MHNPTKLYQLFEHSASKYPEHNALVYCDSKISYAELLVYTNQIQEQLKSISIGSGARVAICAPKSIASVAVILGTLKTGAAYLPVDYSSPIERNQFIISNAEAAALVVSKKLVPHFSNQFEFAANISEDLVLLKNKSSVLKKSPDDLAYILFTSGSTGVPKGVMYSNEGALEFIQWASATFLPTSNDCFSSHAPFHFDLSIFDLFVGLKHGATIVLIDENTAKQPLLLAELICKQRISIWYSTPTILMLLEEYGKLEKYDFAALRLVLFAGEVYPSPKFNQLRIKIPQANYFNLYGPSETNVCTYFKLEQEVVKSIPIGKLCEHYLGVIKDEELWIAGKGLMLGYWNAKLEQCFEMDVNGVKWYNTGDLVSINEHQMFEFKGRRDRMVKRNGYRIELDEIEAALYRHPALKGNAVIAYKNDLEEQRIIAFVID